MSNDGLGNIDGMQDTVKRILVAEDSSALANVVRFNLQQAGFEVVVARDGLEAWQLLQAEAFDLLVTDHQMPELSGCELCGRLRQDARLSKLPVVMLTAKGLELELPRLRQELGVREMLFKPFSVRELVAKIETCLQPSAAGV